MQSFQSISYYGINRTIGTSEIQIFQIFDNNEEDSYFILSFDGAFTCKLNTLYIKLYF